MNDAEDYRRKVRDFFGLAQQLSLPEDRAAMLTFAAFWMERAEEAERGQRVAQGQLRLKKGPAAEIS